MSKSITDRMVSEYKRGKFNFDDELSEVQAEAIEAALPEVSDKFDLAEVAAVANGIYDPEID